LTNARVRISFPASSSCLCIFVNYASGAFCQRAAGRRSTRGTRRQRRNGILNARSLAEPPLDAPRLESQCMVARQDRRSDGGRTPSICRAAGACSGCVHLPSPAAILPSDGPGGRLGRRTGRRPMDGVGVLVRTAVAGKFRVPAMWSLLPQPRLFPTADRPDATPSRALRRPEPGILLTACEFVGQAWFAFLGSELRGYSPGSRVSPMPWQRSPLRCSHDCPRPAIRSENAAPGRGAGNVPRHRPDPSFPTIRETCGRRRKGGSWPPKSSSHGVCAAGSFNLISMGKPS
jgi:hypothetical protein